MQSTNSLEKYLTEGAAWNRAHQEQTWAITGGAFLFILLIALVLHHRERDRNEAWLELGGIQGQAMESKYVEAGKSLDAWESHFQGTDAATYAKFMRADLLYRTSDYAKAAEVYGGLAQTGRPDIVRPLALSAQASSEEMAGHYPQALKLLQAFLDRYPDHFLAAPAYLSEARLLELTGDAAGAAAVYNRYILLFPQSPWTEFARTRTRYLSTTPPAALPK